MISVLRRQRPWLVAGALATTGAVLLWPLRAVPLTSAEAATPRTVDDGAVAADAMAVRAVLRVSGASHRQGQRPMTT
jgi:hypothetical protein